MAAVGAGATPVGVVAAPGAYPSLLSVGIFDVKNNLSQPDAAIQWAMRHGLLAGSRACRCCPGQVAMVLEDYGEGDGKRWRCPTQGCRSTLSIHSGSFYTNSKMLLRDCVMVNNSVNLLVVNGFSGVNDLDLPVYSNVKDAYCI